MNLCIITNESVFKKDQKYFCDNLDLKSIPEELSKHFEVSVYARHSKQDRNNEINTQNINIFRSLFSFIFEFPKKIKKQNSHYLLISLTPITLIASLILSLYRKKYFLYLRSDGFKEYKSILGFYGPFIYYLIFSIGTKFAKLISCRDHLLRGKQGKIVSPSQLSEKWFLNRINPELNKPKLLYVGRLKIEKGIFSLLNLLKKDELNIDLTIVTSEKNNESKILQKNISIFSHQNINDSIIKFYDTHNIFILPSFTEAHPQVLDEALARFRPVIIFDDIKHVVRNRKGVFVSSRNINSLKNKIKYIMENYENIQKDLRNNVLPTKKAFINDLKDIIGKG